MFRLRIEKGGKQKGETFDLPEGETLVGRSSKAMLQLPRPDVSGTHLLISVSEGRPIAKNLSKYGTRIDQQLFAEAIELHNGQRLYLGLNTVLLVEETEDLQGTDPEQEIIITRPGDDDPSGSIVKIKYAAGEEDTSFDDVYTRP